MIITQTPFRMSFFGGGTDMESFFKEYGGSVLSATFDKYCYVNVRHLPRFFDYSTELSYSKTERVTDINDIQHPAIRNAMKMLDINNVTMSETVEAIEQMIAADKKSYVVAINVDVVMKIEEDPYLKKVVDDADMVLVDGKPLVWISKLHGKPLKAKISGSDLVPLLCEVAAEKGYKVFIIGGKDGIAVQAKEKLESKHPKIQIVGTYAPPFGFEKDKKELNHINQMISDVKPDLLVACFGCPKQEKWIYENIGKYDAKVSVCAGATVDFLAGNVKRAPRWMSEHGLEWFYRFLQEPKRMFKRYFVDDIKILKLISKYR